MAGYLWRQRRRRWRILGGLIALAAVALVATWFTGLRPGHLLTGLRPAGTQPAFIPAGTTPDERLPALRPLAGPTDAAGRPAPPLDRRPPDTPARPTTGSPATQEALAGVVSPVTQPAPDPPAGPHAAADLLRAGLALKAQDQLLAAREKINRALHAGLTAAEARTARLALAELADRTLFGRGIVEGDPLADWHLVTSGDNLGRIARRNRVSQELLARINGLRNKNFLREGLRLKLLRGPFHAVIAKRDHEMHLYLQHLYVRTVRVALGQNGSTPTGKWRVVNQLENPPWTDPRTGRIWHPDDPQNPLGEYWIGLEGMEGPALGQPGYGIHGTIEPETIGQDVSLGCVRLSPDDIAFVYTLLMPDASCVVIHE